MKSFFSITTLCLLALSFTANAQPVSEVRPERAFQKIISVPVLEILVPTVVELPLAEQVPLSEKFLIIERETNTYTSSFLRRSPTDYPSLRLAGTLPVVLNASYMTDGDTRTYSEYPVPDIGQGAAKITIVSAEPITTSKLNLHLAQYVALPLTVEVKVLSENDEYQTIVARKRMTSSQVTFPEVTGSMFEVTFTYAQPLRITEIDFTQKALTGGQQALRFLAQPNHTYDVYYQADRPISVRTTESGNLSSDEGVLTLTPFVSQANQFYLPADVDEDGVRDTLDNCVREPNTDQVDIDYNGRGDVCDDFDRDGLLNSRDNCINQPNRNQSDEDGDGIGDVCDDGESRFTEKNPWIPWVGISTAATVLIILFMLVARGTKPPEPEEVKTENN